MSDYRSKERKQLDARKAQRRLLMQLLSGRRGGKRLKEIMKRTRYPEESEATRLGALTALQ